MGGFSDAWSESPLYQSFRRLTSNPAQQNTTSGNGNSTIVLPNNAVPLESFLKLKVRNALLVLELHQATASTNTTQQGELLLTRDMWPFHPDTSAGTFLLFVTSPLLVLLAGLTAKLLTRCKDRNTSNSKHKQASLHVQEGGVPSHLLPEPTGVKICNKYWGQVDISVLEEEDDPRPSD